MKVSSFRKMNLWCFFSVYLSADDIARKVLSTDIIKEAVHMLHEEVTSCTFGLEENHCNAVDLQDRHMHKWEDAETFLAALFNLNRISIDVDDSNKKEIDPDDMILDYDFASDNTDDKAADTPCSTIIKSIPTYSIYQMMVYAITDGKIKTGQSVYSRCHSRSTITSLNKICVSTSFDIVRRDWDLLASYAIRKSQKQ